jgi:hypothetical protein
MAHIEDSGRRSSTGSGYTLTATAGGDRWRARYLDPAGRERSRTFGRKLDAERFLAGVESDKSRGLYVDPAAGRVTVAEYPATWQAVQLRRATTAAAFDSHLRTMPTLGHRPLAAVTRSEVQARVKSRSQVLAPATATATVYAVLRMVFRAAVADRVIAVSPCDRISLPKAPRREVVPLPRETVVAHRGLSGSLSGPARDGRYVVVPGRAVRPGTLSVDFLRRTVISKRS